MKLHLQFPHESSMDPMDLGSKGQGHNETSHAVSLWVKYVPYEIKGQKVKGQGHNARITENGFLRITASPLHLSLWNFTCSFPMSRVWTLWTLGSKGQRSRSQCKDYWKRFLGHTNVTASPLHLSSWNFTCSLPMSRVWTLWTLGSKGQRSRSQCKDYWKRFLAHICFPYLVHNLESLNWLPRGGILSR